MKILFLDGLTGETSLIPLRLASRYNCTSFNVITPELDMLHQKYDDWSRIPEPDIISQNEFAAYRVLAEIEEKDPDVVIAAGYACCILSNLKSDCQWSGLSVFLGPEGHFYDSTCCEDPLIDEPTDGTADLWVMTTETNRTSIERQVHFHHSIIVELPTSELEPICDSGLLFGFLDLLQP